MRLPIGYIVASAVVVVGILGVLYVIPVFPAPPVAGPCAWWNLPCQWSSGVQNAYNAALYGIARLMASVLVAIAALVVLVLPIGRFGPRALTALGVGLIALALAGF